MPPFTPTLKMRLSQILFSSAFLARCTHALPPHLPNAIIATSNHEVQVVRRSPEPQVPETSVPFTVLPPAYVDTICTPGTTIRNPSFELGSQGPSGGPFGTLEGWRLYPLDSTGSGNWFLEGNASFPDQQAGMGENNMFPGNGYSLATNLTTTVSTTNPILGVSQFISICPSTPYTMYFYFAVTDRSTDASAAPTPAASALALADCKLYYGFSFTPLPPNFGNWVAPSTFSSISSNGTGATFLDTDFNFQLLSSTLAPSASASRNGTYIQAVISCPGAAGSTPPAAVAAAVAGGYIGIYLDNFFITSP